MKRLATLLLAAALAFTATHEANAIEFKAQGQWLMGFAAAEGSFVKDTTSNGKKSKFNEGDIFSARQRVRIQLDAVASENLSGNVYFEIGNTTWGKSENNGGALGADSTDIIKLKRAYIDWRVPNSELSVRMGIQGVTLPNAAGGSAILDDDVAGVVANYKFNDNVGLTLSWMRPYNDNYSHVGDTATGNNKDNFLDNLDLISLALPLTFDGIEATPWVMYGIIGQNALRQNSNYRTFFTQSGYEPGNGRWRNVANDSLSRGKEANTSGFWAGIPVTLSLLDPISIEFDFNYGRVQSQGRGYMTDVYGNIKHYNTKREGWLAKALVEYKMDWGVPGIFGWYASGDDGNPGNGSERLPSISACGNFTSFMGDGNFGWSSGGNLFDRNLSYAGTWGIGLQVRDMSFLEDLKHTFRVAYWGGTNDPVMTKYADAAWGWISGVDDENYADQELYLTKNDGILEFNLVNSYQMYENFEINFELGYMVNFIDQDTWKRSRTTNEAYSKQDAWKAQLIFAYSF